MRILYPPGILNGALLQADSVQSSAISQHYKAEVTNEIGETASSIEQAFVAADEQLLSLITSVQTVLTGDVETLETTVSQLRQTVESLTLSYTSKTAGGINNIRNSSGLNGVSDRLELFGLRRSTANGGGYQQHLLGLSLSAAHCYAVTRDNRTTRQKIYAYFPRPCSNEQQVLRAAQ